MRTSKIVLLVAGILSLVVALVWRPVVVPRLTKLPTSLNSSVVFAGTYTAGAQTLPLTINRHVTAVASKSTSADLVVNDASANTIGPQKSTAVLQYVLNRSTSQNVKSPYAYALNPSNVVNRTGSYSLGTPPGVDQAKSYPLWVDEIGRGVPQTSEHSTQTIDGMTAQRWQLNLPATPMVASMVTAMHLPTTMSFATFAAQLKAQGVDLAATFQALAPSLTAAQRASLAALTAKPITLNYLYASHSQMLVEPATGATVDVVTAVRSYLVRPDLTPLAAGLAPILAAHASNPIVAKLAGAAKQLTSAPAQPAFTLTFHQTPASVAATVGTVGHNVTLLNVIKLWIPIILGLNGLILIGFGLRNRRRRPAPPVVKPEQTGTQPVGV